MSQTPDRAAQLADTLKEIQRDAGQCLEALSFADVLSTVERARAQLEETEAELTRLRARGYAWRGDLEGQLAGARAAEADAVSATQATIRDRAHDLRPRVDALAREAREIARRGNVLAQALAIETLDTERDGVERAVRAAEQQARAHLEPFTGPIAPVAAKVKDLHWTLDSFESASFKLAPSESVLAAAEAVWDDPPDSVKKAGLLLLTDHRLRFEQREEIVTRKTFFFFAAEKEQVQKLWIDEPIGHLASSDDHTRGWVLKDQLLTFSWSGEARCPKTTTLELSSGTAKEWDDVVEAIRAGDLDRHRYRGEVAAAATLSVPVSWPERCVSCGGALNPPVKGQTVIVCGYCGHNHPVVVG